jgi:hypothetical protein
MSERWVIHGRAMGEQWMSDGWLDGRVHVKDMEMRRVEWNTKDGLKMEDRGRRRVLTRRASRVSSPPRLVTRPLLNHFFRFTLFDFIFHLHLSPSYLSPSSSQSYTQSHSFIVVSFTCSSHSLAFRSRLYPSLLILVVVLAAVDNQHSIQPKGSFASTRVVSS